MQVKQHQKENVNCEDCGSIYCQVCYIACPNCSSIHITNPSPTIKWELGDGEFINPRIKYPVDKIFYNKIINNFKRKQYE